MCLKSTEIWLFVQQFNAVIMSYIAKVWCFAKARLNEAIFYQSCVFFRTQPSTILTVQVPTAVAIARFVCLESERVVVRTPIICT